VAPLVSIVTPSLNQGAFLEETMVSVLEQDYPNLEYVVVDGASTDGSVDVIRRYADRLAWWASEPDRGQAHALNKGFARAGGEYLTWLCSDDTLLPGAVSRLVTALESSPRAVLAYGDAVYTDARSERKHAARSGPWDPVAMVRHAQVPNQQPATLYTRRGWEEAGPLDEEAWYYLDLQFTIRLAGAGDGMHVSEPLATYRIHPAGKSTGRPARKAEDALRCAERFMTTDLVPGALRPYTREGRASLYRIAGDNFYAALELGRARRAYFKAREPARLAKSMLPRPVVRRLRARRLERAARARGPRAAGLRSRDAGQGRPDR
jgi:glycosyltransferase involved in cell wall biosynthesis